MRTIKYNIIPGWRKINNEWEYFSAQKLIADNNIHPKYCVIGKVASKKFVNVTPEGLNNGPCMPK